MSQAFAALNAAPGARAFHDDLRARGIEHNDALRRLANRLVGILHGCQKTRTLSTRPPSGPTGETSPNLVSQLDTKAHEMSCVWHAPCMSEQPATTDNSHHGPGLGGTWPDPAPRPPNQRRHTAVWCGLLAGIGVGIMVATLIHAIEQANPSGSYSGFGETVLFVVVIAGSLLGFGLGGVAAALIPAAEPLREAQPSPVAGAEIAKGS
jgi:hypothetical protein